MLLLPVDVFLSAAVLSSDDLSEDLSDAVFALSELPATGAELSLNSVGISGDDRCIYPSKNEIPNYNEALAESYGFYNFTGLYTKGEYDEYGYLICYMWGVGIF